MRQLLARAAAPLRHAHGAYWLARLARCPQPLARRVALALAQPAYADAEHAAMAAIEAQRRRLAADGGPLAPADSPRLCDRGKSIADVGAASTTASRGRLLYVLTRAARPASALELGTNLGLGAAYIASALTGLGGGRLTTIEGSPDRARIAAGVFAQLQLRNVRQVVGMFDEVLPAILPGIAPVDVAFIDGNHYYEATLRYFDTLLAHAADDAIVIFDDIRWWRTRDAPGKQMLDAWSEARRRPGVVASIDFGDIGLCIASRRGGPSRPIHTPRLHLAL